MKENSIEEDITRIKQRIEDVKEYIRKLEDEMIKKEKN